MACDACGGGGSSNYLGIIPNFSKNFIGIKYQNQTFTYVENEINTNGSSIVEEDILQKSELWMRFYYQKRWHFFVFIPYHFHQRIESLRTTNINSIGDMRALGFYTLVNQGDSLNKKHQHTWLLGAGVKLPTGKYQQRDQTKAMLPILFQIGTGAYAFSYQNIYTYRYKNWGINSDLQLQWNTQNEIGDRLGNALSGTGQLFYVHKKMNYSLMPYIGGKWESKAKNQYFGNAIRETGGNASLFILGMDFFYQRWMLQGTFNQPIQLQLNDAMPQNNWSFSLGLNYFL